MRTGKQNLQAISAQVHDWAAENRLLRKELCVREKRIEELEALASSLNKQLCEKIDQINDNDAKAHGFYDKRRRCKLFAIPSPFNRR